MASFKRMLLLIKYSMNWITSSSVALDCYCSISYLFSFADSFGFITNLGFYDFILLAFTPYKMFIWFVKLYYHNLASAINIVIWRKHFIIVIISAKHINLIMKTKHFKIEGDKSIYSKKTEN